MMNISELCVLGKSCHHEWCDACDSGDCCTTNYKKQSDILQEYFKAGLTRAVEKIRNTKVMDGSGTEKFVLETVAKAIEAERDSL